MNEYHYAVGRRKSAVATVRVYKGGKGDITVNEKKFEDHFPVWTDRDVIKAPLKATGKTSEFDISIRVSGGGIHAQADAAQLGIARALLKEDAGYKAILKKEGFLTRDPRVKERKKPGLKGARRSEQFSKR